MEWRHSGSHHSKKFRVKKSVGKDLASIILGSRRYPPIGYLPKGQTINAEYYSSLLVQLRDILKEERRGKVTKGVLFLHDNPSAHWALLTQNKLVSMGFQCLDHPPYSTNLAPSNYKPFPGMTKTLKVRHLSSDAEVISAAETWLGEQIVNIY